MTRSKAEEAQQCDPCEAHTARHVEGGLQSGARLLMLGAGFVGRKEQHVHIGQLQRFDRRRCILTMVSASPSSVASERALVRSTSGWPMSKVGCSNGLTAFRRALVKPSRIAAFSTCLNDSPR